MNPNWNGVAALSLLLFSAPVAAAGMHVTRNLYGEVRSLEVRTGDLNLASKAGAEELLSRLQFAVDQVCDVGTDDQDLKMHSLHQTCVRSTMTRSVAALRAPLVSRLYTNQGRQPARRLAEN